MSANQPASCDDDDPNRRTNVEPSNDYTERLVCKKWDCAEIGVIPPTHLLSGTLTVERSADPKMVGAVVSIETVPFTLGRHDCDVTFERAQGVSRKHAQITFEEGAYFIADTGSTNHTFIDDRELQVNVPAPLHNGAIIRLGAYTVMIFSIQVHRGKSGGN
jgi:pSer/pThr/pTyr-binding forkhead associated (FHA) protein